MMYTIVHKPTGNIMPVFTSPRSKGLTTKAERDAMPSWRPTHLEPEEWNIEKLLAHPRYFVSEAAAKRSLRKYCQGRYYKNTENTKKVKTYVPTTGYKGAHSDIFKSGSEDRPYGGKILNQYARNPEDFEVRLLKFVTEPLPNIHGE